MSLSNKLFSVRNIKLFNVTRTMTQLALKPETLEQQDKIVLKPLAYLQNAMYQPEHVAPINVYRPFNYWLKVPEDKFAAIDKFMDMYQSVAVLIDDIIDSTNYRYGMPAAQTIYGDALSINSVCFGLLKSIEMLSDMDPRASKYCIDAASDYFRGTGLEIYWRDNSICPSEEDYINMIKQKNCSFMILAYKLQQLFSDYEVDCTKVAEDVGLYHQLLDDYRDIFSTEILDEKSCSTDITEGKFTLPIIHALKHSENSEEIMNILRLHTEDPQLKKWFITLLQKAGSFEYSRHVLSKLETEIHDEVKRLGGNPFMIAAVENLGNWREVNTN